jgi:hypothetical protein
MSDEPRDFVSYAVNPRVMLRARDLYATYCASSDGKNFQGNPCPAWDALPEAVRGHWYTVALRTCSYMGFGTEVGREVETPPDENHVLAHLPSGASRVWAEYIGHSAASEAAE